MRNHLRKVTGQRWRSAGKRSTAKDCAAIQLNFRTLKSWRRGGRRRRRGLPCWRSEFFLGNLSTSCCRRRSSRWLSLASSWVSTRRGRPSPSTYNAFSRWKYKKSKKCPECMFVFSHVHFFAETVWLWRRVWGPKPNRPGAQVSPEGEENVPRFQVEATQAMLDKQLLANKKKLKQSRIRGRQLKKNTLWKTHPPVFPCRRDRG